MALATEWAENEWEAEFWAGHLVVTHPSGECAEVGLRDAQGRNITLREFRSSVKSHGVTKACRTFWKLRANA